jgi:hypothetical protein
MSNARVFLVALLLLSPGCGSDSDPAGPDAGDPGLNPPSNPVVTSVLVESPVTMLWDAGQSTQLTGTALDSDGEPIPGVELNWTTANPAVAVVAGGVVTATGDGWVEIRGAAGGHSAGVQIIVVTPDGPTDRLDCIACHATEFITQHGATNTPQTCRVCHTGQTWQEVQFDHASVADGFELLGAHAWLPCTACHDSGGDPTYPGVTDDECVACHQADYDGRHAGSGYPTTCLTCHTTETWQGAEFDHDALYFPIAAGKHQGRWTGCETCHVDASNYAVFSCFACHPHDQDRMDDKHSENPNYVYDSAFCYACHPDGTSS